MQFHSIRQKASFEMDFFLPFGIDCSLLPPPRKRVVKKTLKPPQASPTRKHYLVVALLTNKKKREPQKAKGAYKLPISTRPSYSE